MKAYLQRLLHDPSYSLAFAWCINSLAYSIVYPFLPLYLHSSRGIPMATVGLIFPIMGVGVMLGPPISGWLVDHFGRKTVLFHGSTARGLVFLLLTALALVEAPFWMFAVAMFFNACIGTFFQNASDAYLTDVTTVTERPKAYSRIRVGTNVGWALGPIIGSFLAQTPFALLFFITALLCFIGAAYVAYVLRETRPVVASDSQEPGEIGTFKWRDMHMVYLLTIFFAFILFMLVSQLYTTLSVFCTDIVGISKNHLGFVYSINGLAIVFFQIPVTHLLDRLRMPGFLRIIAGAAFYGAGYFAVAFCYDAFSTALAIVVITFGEIIIQPAVYTAVSRMSPSYCVGRFMGGFGLMRGLGFALGPYFGALLFSSYSHQPVMLWGMLASAAVVSIIGFFFVWWLSLRPVARTGE